MLYVYLDETTFGEFSDQSGYGCLFSKERIGHTVIREALLNLEKDKDRFKPKFQKQDQRTLERSFFHSADDSQNAHSHLCDSLNKHIKGNFKTHIINKKASLICTEDAYYLSAKLSIIEAFWISKDITFIFEERNDLTEQKLRLWWEALWGELIFTACRRPYYVTYFPEFKYEICSKDEPGLQIVDFLLWASSRKAMGKNCPWLSRVKSFLQMKLDVDNNSWGGHSLDINGGNRIKFSYSKDDFEKESLSSFTRSELVSNYIVNAYKVISLLHSCGPNPPYQHFWDDIDSVHTGKLYPQKPEHGLLLAKTFIKAFDNIELIKPDNSSEEKSFWLNCRQYFACLLAPTNSLDCSEIMYFTDVRNKIFKINKAY